MTEPASTDPDITSLLRELDAARALILHAQEGPKGGEIALRAFTLSVEVKLLCQAAAASADETRRRHLIVRSRNNLNEIQHFLKNIRLYELCFVNHLDTQEETTPLALGLGSQHMPFTRRQSESL